MEEAPQKPNGIGRRRTYILSVEYVPITLSAGELHHLKSKALSGNMVVFYQQYAEKHLLFLQFFPLSDVYSSLKHHTPYAESFHPHIKEPLILPSVFGLVKEYPSLSTCAKFFVFVLKGG